MSTVCISAGHNPYKQGASYEGLTEYSEAVDWSVLPCLEVKMWAEDLKHSICQAQSTERLLQKSCSLICRLCSYLTGKLKKVCCE